jgi:bifunctional DNA-binding transcriptional regulator/antitoxin component of YhaV-PrlF toxin-antitoxin module
MEALEFVTKIKDRQIVVPEKIQSALDSNKDKEIRVIVLIEGNESGDDNDSFIKKSVQDQFLKGYADTDSIYDNL